MYMMASTSDDKNPDADDAGVRGSFVALGLVAIFVALALWVWSAFQENRRQIACMQSGHHNCVPLDTSVKGKAP